MSERPDLAGDGSLAGMIALPGFALLATARATNIILACGFAGSVSPFTLAFSGGKRTSRTYEDSGRARTPHCPTMPLVFATAVSFSWSDFISAASSFSVIGLPGMSATASFFCTAGFCSTLLIA